MLSVLVGYVQKWIIKLLGICSAMLQLRAWVGSLKSSRSLKVTTLLSLFPLLSGFPHLNLFQHEINKRTIE